MKTLVRNTFLLSAVVAASSVSAADCYYPTQPCCSEWSVGDGKFTIGADYLYWKSEQDGLNIVSSTTTTTSTTAPFTTAVTSEQNPGFDWESGYRVYAAYELPCDQWELGASYTYIPGKAKFSSLTSNVSTNQLISDNYLNFAGSWNSTFQYVDIELARTLKFGESFRLCPHAGFRAAWGDQALHTDGDLTAVLFADPAANHLHTSYKQKFNAYGVEAGLWGEWKVFCNFSVVGHFGGSILYSKNTFHREDIYSVNAVGQTPSYISSTETTHETTHTALPSVDYFLGVRFVDNFCDWDFSVYAGWESHVWFDLGNLYDRGNFSTQGLTAGLDVSF